MLVWGLVQAPDLGDRRLPPPGTLLSVWCISYVLFGSAFQVEAGEGNGTPLQYSCHLFLISSASVRSIPFLSFIEPIFA